MVEGAGKVTFGSAVALSRRKQNSSIAIGCRRATLPVTSGAVKVSVWPCSSRKVKRDWLMLKPSVRSTKRLQYEARRNSPSVTTPSPTSACSLMASRIAASCAATKAGFVEGALVEGAIGLA